MPLERGDLWDAMDRFAEFNHKEKRLDRLCVIAAGVAANSRFLDVFEDDAKTWHDKVVSHSRAILAKLEEE